MTKDQEAAYKQGYQAAEKHYQAQVAALQADMAHLERSKGAAKYIIKDQAAKLLRIGG